MTSSSCVSEQGPLFGETYTLHEAIALIAFGDPRQPLDQPVTKEIIEFKGSINSQEMSKTEQIGTSFLRAPELAIRPRGVQAIEYWIAFRADRHSRVAIAAQSLARAINRNEIPLCGYRIKHEFNRQFNRLVGTINENPIPVAMLSNDVSIPFDFLLNDGGRLLFKTGSISDWDDLVVYCEVRLSKESIERQFKPSPDIRTRPKPASAAAVRDKMSEYARKMRELGWKPSQEDMDQATKDGLSPLFVSSDQLRHAFSSGIPKEHKLGRGEKRKMPSGSPIPKSGA